jgi:hypothetical protein
MPVDTASLTPIGPNTGIPTYTRVFDPAESRTRVWDSSGLVGFEDGNTEKFGSGLGPIDSQKFGNPLQYKPGGIDWGATVKDLIPQLVTAGVGAAVPEVKAMSPLKNLLLKMGLSFGGGAAADQLLNPDKPLLNSAVQSGLNTGLGIGLPELLNVGVKPGDITRTTLSSAEPTIIQRANSGTNLTNSSTLGFNPQDYETKVILERNTKGHFTGNRTTKQVPIEDSTQRLENQYQTNSSTQTTSSDQGRTIANPGDRTTQVDIGSGQGWFAHVADLLKNLQSMRYNGLMGPGAGNLNPLSSALLGLGLNIAATPTQTKQIINSNGR